MVLWVLGLITIGFLIIHGLTYKQITFTSCLLCLSSVYFLDRSALSILNLCTIVPVANIILRSDTLTGTDIGYILIYLFIISILAIFHLYKILIVVSVISVFIIERNYAKLC